MTPRPLAEHLAPAPVPPNRRRGPRRRARWLVGALAVVAGVASGCGSSTADEGYQPNRPEVDVDQEGPGPTYPRPTLEMVDAMLVERVERDGLAGGAIIVEPADGERHVRTIGAVGPDTPTALAESSFWLVATVLMTMVDDGAAGLDAPIGTHLAWLAGESGEITLRQLLSHTSGLPLTVDCGDPTPAACDRALAAIPLAHRPGTTFSVTDLDAHVAARLAETVSDRSWAELVQERIVDPVGMTATTFADPADTGGLLAVDATSTPEDLGRFLDVIRDDGRIGEVEVLSPGSWREMLLDQTVRLDTHDEPWVADTGVPTFGLGVWRDRLRGDDAAATVSAPNRFGLYPLVDTARDTWAIVVVDDRTGSRRRAVGGSATLAQLTAAALRAAAPAPAPAPVPD